MIFAWYERSDDSFRWWFVVLFFDPIRDVIIGSVELGRRKVLIRFRNVGRSVDRNVGERSPEVIWMRWS